MSLDPPDPTPDPPAPPPAQCISNMLIDAVITQLNTKLIAEPDNLKVRTVRFGRLQDNPQKEEGFNVLVFNEAEEWPIKISTEQDTKGRLGAYPHTIGGGSFYIHPVVVTLNLHFKGIRVRDVARVRAHTIMARAKQAIRLMQMPQNPNTETARDDFGEGAIDKEIVTYYLREAGGVGNFIYKGELVIHFLTEQI